MKRYIAISIIVIILFYIPMFKLFSDLVVKAFNLGLMLYWIILTLFAVFIGFKTLKRLIGEAL
uniref:Uncharacterized protein n=1 Tax=Ignisphaera aggregans TaxID=334771 RepID=A0A7C5UVZ6_9CREN